MAMTYADHVAQAKKLADRVAKLPAKPSLSDYRTAVNGITLAGIVILCESKAENATLVCEIIRAAATRLNERELARVEAEEFAAWKAERAAKHAA